MLGFTGFFFFASSESSCILIENGMRDSSAKTMYSKKGNRMMAVTTTGTIMFAVYSTNLIWKAPASTRLVGLEETRIAEAMFATANWVWIHALGWIMLLDTRVM